VNLHVGLFRSLFLEMRAIPILADSGKAGQSRRIDYRANVTIIDAMPRWINPAFTPDKSAFRFTACIQLADGGTMRKKTLTLPEIGLIAGTRVALGIGIGLLVADKLNRDTRKGAAIALLLVGALSTIPIAVGILGEPEAGGVPEWG
jgi:hypothetical protein